MISLQISLVCVIGSSQYKCHYFGEAGWECSPAGCTFSFSFFSDQKNRDSLSLFAIVSQFPFFGKVVATTPLPFLACGTFKNGAFMCAPCDSARELICFRRTSEAGNKKRTRWYVGGGRIGDLAVVQANMIFCVDIGSATVPIVFACVFQRSTGICKAYGKHLFEIDAF